MNAENTNKLATAPKTWSPDPSHSSYPNVMLPGEYVPLSECASRIGKILVASKIFLHNGSVVTIDERQCALTVMTPDLLRTWIEDHMICGRVWKDKKTGRTVGYPFTMTRSDATALLVAPQFTRQLRRIERFNPIRMPVMSTGGQIELLPEGYDSLPPFLWSQY